MDESGYIAITGRIKDLIIRGGENISPLEIENCLISHPDILEASVVGLNDEHYGEIVAAFCVLREESQGVSGENSKTVDSLFHPRSEALKEWVGGRLSSHLGKSSNPCAYLPTSVVSNLIILRRSRKPRVPRKDVSKKNHSNLTTL